MEELNKLKFISGLTDVESGNNSHMMTLLQEKLINQAS